MCFCFKAPHNVTRFSMSANSGENFMIDPVTGKVALKKSLLGADSERYEVSMRYELRIRHNYEVRVS